MPRRGSGFWKFLFRADGRAGRRRRHVFARGLATILIVVGINSTWQKHGAYERYEWTDLDRLQSTFSHRGDSPGISVVLISTQDYEDVATFKSKSPLHPPAVLDLIDAICRYQPLVLGVDLVTAEWDDSDRSRASRATCSIVWSYDVLVDTPGDEPGGESDLSPVRLGRVLGGGEPEGDRSCAAVPVLPPESDGVVRDYVAYYPVVAALGSEAAAGPQTKPVQRPAPRITLAAALARSQSGRLGCLGGRESLTSNIEKDKIRFTANADIPRVNAGLVLRTSRDLDEPQVVKLVSAAISGRIVILGAAYRQARDQHVTPIGPLSGAEVLANAAYTAQPGHAIWKVRWWVSGLVDLAVGAALLSLIVPLRLRWPWRFALSAVGTILAAGLVSWHLFNYAGYFLGVFGALAGVLLAIIVEPLYDQWLEFYPKLLDHLSGDQHS